MKYRNQTIKRLADDPVTGKERWSVNGQGFDISEHRRTGRGWKACETYPSSRSEAEALAGRIADESLRIARDLCIALPDELHKALVG